MSSGGIVWHGLSEFKAGLDKAVAEAYKAGQRGANNAAVLVEKATKAKLATTTHKRGTPTPSRPGEPPSLISGQLRRSVTIVPAVPQGATAWVSKVGPTAVQSRVQELGGSTGRAVLPARPYLEPSVRELIDNETLWLAFRSGYARF